MGYDVHITRRADWFDEHGPEITLAEWLDHARAQPDLSAAEDGAAEWTAPNGAPHPLWWYEGTVQTKNPATALIARMHAIAVALDAKVQGDEGEVYGRDGTAIGPENLGQPPKPGIIARLLGKS